jgi:general secretion pathway protein B
MSSILDALRKSELERQKVTGQGISLPYPATIKYESNSRLIPVLLAITVATCIGLAIWWTGFTTNDNKPAIPPVSASPTALLPKPVVTDSEIKPVVTDSEVKPVVADSEVKSLPKPLKRTDVIHSKRVANVPHKQPAANLAVSAPIAVAPSKPDSDPAKELPPLEVTGYIHNEQGDNLAVINDKLIKEGDEISPGLRVEKIKDNSVIFNYKGYVFSR